ncbi:MAG: hypothetical protein IKG27_04620 [Bacilli bacterium]|nr:hypothetical protein [Bacilli bacterium]
MKKRYGLLFLLCLLMFFCVNIDGVEAENIKCSSDISNVEKAYAANYSGSGSSTGQDWSTSFTFVIVKYDGDKYCSMVSNPRFVYNDPTKIIDYSFTASAANIRDVVFFNINYENVYNSTSGKSPNLSLCVEADWGMVHYKGLKQFQVRDSNSCPLSYLNIVNMPGSDWVELDAKKLEEILKNTTLTSEQVIEAIQNWANKGYIYDQPISDPEEKTCREVLTPELAGILKNFFFILSIIGVILVIATGMTDFLGSITSGEDDSLLKAFKKIKNRIISVVLLLLLPFIVGILIDFANTHLIYDEKSEKIKVGNVSECFDSSSSSSSGSGGTRRATTK